NTGLIRSNTYHVRLGNYDNLNIPFTNGTLDDVRLWSRALSDREIWGLYNQWQATTAPSGFLNDIGAGADVWGVNTAGTAWKFTAPSTWTSYGGVSAPNGQLSQITAGTSGQVWAVSLNGANGSVFHATSANNWGSPIGGAMARDIGYYNNQPW